MLSIVCILMLFAGSQAQFTQIGSCQNVLPMRNFVTSKMLGTWYEIERYPNSCQDNQQCICANFVGGKNNQIIIEEYAIHANSGAHIQWNGTATPLGDPSIAQFNMTFPQYTTLPMTNLVILETDYNRYAIMWLYQNMSKTCNVYAWVLSRTVTLDEKIIERAHEILCNHHMPITPLIRVDHTNCPSL